MTRSSPQKISVFVVLSVVGLVAGCGGEFDIAPVSGVVTLDGQPLENASLYFQPHRSDDPVVGPPSIGVTDAEGRYTLLSQSQEYGAVVGTHTVSISTYEERMINPKKSDATEVVTEERVPRRYRAPSELTFVVPPGGASDANFDLTTN